MWGHCDELQQPVSASAVYIFGYFPGGGGLGNPQFLGHAHSGAPAAVRIPNNFTFIGIHSLGQGTGLGLEHGGGLAGIFRRKRRDVNNGVLHRDDAAFNQIFQLPDIARPVVLLQEAQKLRGKFKSLPYSLQNRAKNWWASGRMSSLRSRRGGM